MGDRMKNDYQIWNILHDGVLAEIKGDISGDLKIRVEIEYLARKLKGRFSSIFVTLKNCSLFIYERYWTKDNVQIFTSPNELEGITPAIVTLSCDEMDDHLLIDDICGSIKTRYDSAELTLENGDPLAFQELDNISKEYWDNFGAKQDP